MPVGHIRELTGVSNAQFDIPRIIDLSASRIDLIDSRLRRSLDIHDDQTVFPGRHKSVAARHIKAAGIGQRH